MRSVAVPAPDFSSRSEFETLSWQTVAGVGAGIPILALSKAGSSVEPRTGDHFVERDVQS